MPEQEPTESLGDAVGAVLRELTPAEKFELISGLPHWFVKPNRRVGLPGLQTANGPAGLRPFLKSPVLPEFVSGSAKTTAHPAGIALAATWDPARVRKTAALMGDECNRFGVDILLGPCVCLTKVPFGGRNFESYGEDPRLAASMGAAFIRGVEGEGVGTSLKHFVGNDTDYQRHNVDIRVDDRVLRELYLRPFQLILREQPPETVMFAYNKINGVHMSDNAYLLDDVLRGEWGYDGIVMADWSAVRSQLRAFRAGVDLEMPGSRYFEASLFEEVAKEPALLKQLDEKARRIVRFSLKRERAVRAHTKRPTPRARLRKAAADTARESMVLLKNEAGLLPLDPARHPKLAIIGPNADVLRTGGGGSSMVCAERAPSPLEALRERLDPAHTITHAPGIRRDADLFPIPPECWSVNAEGKRGGLRAEFFNNGECRGEPTVRRTVSRIAFDWGDFSPAEGIYPSFFSVRFSGWVTANPGGEYVLKCLGRGDATVWIDGEPLLRGGNGRTLDDATAIVRFEKGRPHHVRLEFSNMKGKAAVALGWEPHDPDPQATAVAAAAAADVALVFAGTSRFDETEGRDLASPRLPAGQDAFIREIAAANPNTVVVLNNGTPLFLDRWIDHVPALLEAWFPGQEGGVALADLLSGEESPCGKLPFTFFRSGHDNPAVRHYPKVRDTSADVAVEDIDTRIEARADEDPHIEYAEGLDLGYRHADRIGERPLFPFGFGLGYTTFALSDAKLSGRRLNPGGRLRLSVRLTNTGDREGAEVVQLYLGPDPSRADRPIKQLAAFRKVRLAPGAAKTVRFDIRSTDLETYDPDQRAWITPPGDYLAFVGTSAADIHARLGFTHA